MATSRDRKKNPPFLNRAEKWKCNIKIISNKIDIRHNNIKFFVTSNFVLFLLRSLEFLRNKNMIDGFAKNVMNLIS